jgi:hypothetical protein
VFDFSLGQAKTRAATCSLNVRSLKIAKWNCKFDPVLGCTTWHFDIPLFGVGVMSAFSWLTFAQQKSEYEAIVFICNAASMQLSQWKTSYSIPL